MLQQQRPWRLVGMGGTKKISGGINLQIPEMALYHQIQVFCVKRPPSILESSWNIFFIPPIGNIVRFPDLFEESPIGVPLIIDSFWFKQQHPTTSGLRPLEASSNMTSHQRIQALQAQAAVEQLSGSDLKGQLPSSKRR